VSLIDQQLLQHRSNVRGRALNPEREPRVKLLITSVKTKRSSRIKAAANVHDPGVGSVF